MNMKKNLIITTYKRNGHIGDNRCAEKIKELRYYWENMAEEINYIIILNKR